MTGAPSWTILVPTLGERRPLFERLMAGLLPQLDPYAGRARVVAWHNNGKPSLPVIRHKMMQAVKSDYLSFVDDDDLVSPFFVAEVMAALDARPDYVGFQIQCYSDGVPTGIAYHSLEYKRWRNLKGRYERDISHINPMRSALARAADFRHARAGAPEDRAWVDQLRRGRYLKSQVVIDRILYHYLYSTSRTRWKNPRLIKHDPWRSVIDSPHFTWSPDAV